MGGMSDNNGGQQSNSGPAQLATTGGALLNVLGALSGSGAMGNQALSYGNSLQKNQQSQVNDNQQAQNDAAGISALKPRIDNLDEIYQPYAQHLANTGDLKGLAAYLPQSESHMSLADERDAHHEEAAQRLNDAAQKASDLKLGKDARGMDQSLAGAESSLKKASDPQVDMMQRAQSMLQNSSDPDALVSSKGNLQLALQGAGIKLNSNGKDSKELGAVQSKLQDYVNSKKTGGILGVGASLPQGVDKQQLFGDFLEKTVPSAMLQKHQSAQDQAAAISFIRTELKDPDAKQSGIGHAQMLNQAVQMMNSGKADQVTKGRAAVQKLRALGENNN